MIDTYFSHFSLQHISRGVYRGYMELLKLIIEGYEYSVQFKGLGGLTSVFGFLEITHRYFCGKRYKDDSTVENTEEAGAKSSKPLKSKDRSQKIEKHTDMDSSDSLHFHRGLKLCKLCYVIFISYGK